MIFLIEYDRQRGKLVTFSEFPDEDLAKAERARLELELSRERTDQLNEIVLLQAETEDALRLTHRRYFQSGREIVDAARAE
jgi:hypothetical protein